MVFLGFGVVLVLVLHFPAMADSPSCQNKAKTKKWASKCPPTPIKTASTTKRFPDDDNSKALLELLAATSTAAVRIDILDSTVVLHYMNSESRWFQVFVANRVAVIYDATNPAQ